MASTSNLVKIAALASSLFTSTVTAQFPKRGLAANDDIPISEFSGDGCQVNWQYNWGSTTTNKQSNLEYTPMLWDASSGSTDNWQANADYWLQDGGSGHLLGFNEPDNAGQANMSPSDAIAAYLQWITPYAGSASLVSPAITNAGAEWLQEFLDGCGDCGISYVAAHWYDQATNFAYFTEYIDQICGIANGLQVWITEFQGFGSIDDESAFLDQAIPYLDSNPCIYRYAYFATSDIEQDFLENGGPSLSPLGIQYTYTAY